MTYPDGGVGEPSARPIQNGHFISGKAGEVFDQTTTPGSRTALIQGYVGDTK